MTDLKRYQKSLTKKRFYYIIKVKEITRTIAEAVVVEIAKTVTLVIKVVKFVYLFLNLLN
ncbi:hypothetical protein SDC9_202911 [bioreactor metagenome]|uniref:Uncharacterized protein n=1 Tax=bioreactor metagenome TaxID=1076179 RepID=A0A645IV73_9ZZZZ